MHVHININTYIDCADIDGASSAPRYQRFDSKSKGGHIKSRLWNRVCPREKKAMDDADKKLKLKSKVIKKKKKADLSASFGSYIIKLAKANHSNNSVTKGAVMQLDGIVKYLVERYAKEGGKISTYAKSSTYSQIAAETATSVIFPPKMRPSVLEAGKDAVQKVKDAEEAKAMAKNRGA